MEKRKNFEEVIEPSEIIVDVPPLKKKELEKFFPWVRFLARFFDYSLFFLIQSFFYPRFLGMTISFVPIFFFLWIPIETLCMTLLGYTPGKFILSIRVLEPKRKTLSLPCSLRRSLSVWFRGMGMGIPFVFIFTFFSAYTKLSRLGQTSWDREEKCLVQHKGIEIYRYVIALLGIVFGQIMFVLSKFW